MDIPSAIHRRTVLFWDSVRNESDPRTRNWLLVEDTPIYVWACTSLYLIFVLWLGPLLMRNRKPFELRFFMIIYNSGLVALSTYMVYEIWGSAYENGYNPICQPYSNKVDPYKPSEMRMARALWWYFFSKLIEFMDTILMVLRKKDNQITFLHVFHHASMLNIWWLSIMLIPGGQSWFSTSANSFIHIFMYSYYLLNMFPSIRKHLWWKRYLTQMQLVQFLLILIHTSNTYLSGCDFPKWSTIMLITYMFLMLGLFGNFYMKSYNNRANNKSKSLANGGDHYSGENNNHSIKAD